ncbi:type III secretion system inner rod subunit SctI [Pseudomonas sp. D1HM]|uniref:type III secretion system inner rod subunit SctI n=1 Tax=Pseudomonas sp. D1HM TaxID=1784816 RepID=UPI001C4E3115|nr:type III secretion system inner rod subunit SctI [Pseudomonas sp. D1HM]
MNVTLHTRLPLTPSMTSSSPGQGPETADINWFNASLGMSKPETGLPLSPGPSASPSLSQRSEFLQGLSNLAARRLQDVSKSTDPMDMIKSTRAMSAFHLETVLTAKIVSKTSQAIEKLTTLS